MSLSALRHETHASRRLDAAGADSKGPSNALTSRDDRTPRNPPIQLEPHWQLTIESATD